MLKFYKDPDCPVSGKGTILAAFTTTQATLQPTTREFLATEMKSEANGDLAHGAAFALGASLQNTSNDAQSATALEQIRQSWQLLTSQGSGGNLGDQLALLDAMGNSGRSEYLSELQKTIDESGNPDLRAKAVFALRFMSGSDATQMLSQHLTDADSKVRLASAEAISQARWNEEFREPLQTCAASELLARIQAVCQAALTHASTQAGESH